MRSCKWFASPVRRSLQFALHSRYQSWMPTCCTMETYFCPYVEGCVPVSMKASPPMLRGYFQVRLLLIQAAFCTNVSHLPYHHRALFCSSTPLLLLASCLPAWFWSSLHPVSQLQCGQKTLEKDAFAENQLANLISLPCVAFFFPYPNQLNEKDCKMFLEIT